MGKYIPFYSKIIHHIIYARMKSIFNIMGYLKIANLGMRFSL